MRTWKLNGFPANSMQSWEAKRIPREQHAKLRRLCDWAYQFVKRPVGLLAFRCAVEHLLALLAPFHCVRCMCCCLRLSWYEVRPQAVLTGDEHCARRSGVSARWLRRVTRVQLGWPWTTWLALFGICKCKLPVKMLSSVQTRFLVKFERLVP
jgi:hypothetical protein